MDSDHFSFVTVVVTHGGSFRGVFFSRLRSRVWRDDGIWDDDDDDVMLLFDSFLYITHKHEKRSREKNNQSLRPPNLSVKTEKLRNKRERESADVFTNVCFRSV